MKRSRGDNTLLIVANRDGQRDHAIDELFRSAPSSTRA
jgi:hypothetical protein